MPTTTTAQTVLCRHCCKHVARELTFTFKTFTPSEHVYSCDACVWRKAIIDCLVKDHDVRGALQCLKEYLFAITKKKGQTNG